MRSVETYFSLLARGCPRLSRAVMPCLFPFDLRWSRDCEQNTVATEFASSSTGPYRRPYAITGKLPCWSHADANKVYYGTCRQVQLALYPCPHSHSCSRRQELHRAPVRRGSKKPILHAALKRSILLDVSTRPLPAGQPTPAATSNCQPTRDGRVLTDTQRYKPLIPYDTMRSPWEQYFQHNQTAE